MSDLHHIADRPILQGTHEANRIILFGNTNEEQDFSIRVRSYPEVDKFVWRQGSNTIDNVLSEESSDVYRSTIREKPGGRETYSVKISNNLFETDVTVVVEPEGN